MSGYYEWEEVEDGEQPYFISCPAIVLAAAGLQAAYKDENDEWRSTFTIVAREAKDTSGEIHDRMSVFLETDMIDRWISPEKIEDKDAMLHELDETSTAVAAPITTRPVSRAVNSVARSTAPTPASSNPSRSNEQRGVVVAEAVRVYTTGDSCVRQHDRLISRPADGARKSKTAHPRRIACFLTTDEVEFHASTKEASSDDCESLPSGTFGRRAPC